MRSPYLRVHYKNGAPSPHGLCPTAPCAIRLKPLEHLIYLAMHLIPLTWQYVAFEGSMLIVLLDSLFSRTNVHSGHRPDSSTPLLWRFAHLIRGIKCIARFSFLDFSNCPKEERFRRVTSLWLAPLAGFSRQTPFDTGTKDSISSSQTLP